MGFFILRENLLLNWRKTKKMLQKDFLLLTLKKKGTIRCASPMEAKEILMGSLDWLHLISELLKLVNKIINLLDFNQNWLI
eukprot:CAMPEP_0201110860 /NCGR_PEP_ID=MMETSP0812-20130820/72372_1 /ASSEMBLY_ACC=CAM_ASM_000668 /TAXON_ID=98059 /ORGANISM="Dinobryon sp., Strain UTEXLB2267" /LENGTH=80 /DNA_ID=CAMNT_0047373559 /DNA_START=196 /DNA_END=438 /DNA_ORIENTATION=-